MNEQKIINSLNKQPKFNQTEVAGWVGFFMGVLITSLFFVFIIIPQVENHYEEEREEATHSFFQSYEGPVQPS